MIFCTLCKDSQIKSHFIALIICIAGIVSACQGSPPETLELPTLVRFPTFTVTPVPSETMEVIIIPTHTATATETASPLPTATARLNVFSTDTITPTSSPTPTATATILPQTFIFGQSAGGRDLIAHRYGSGSHTIMLVGGVHAGFEENTINLIFEIQRHFQNNPGTIESGVSFILIPVLNPDGQQEGRVLAGRFNGNNVDLNRNWGCNWSPDAVFGQSIVDAGSEAFSEPETRALGSLIQRVNPVAVIFYHSAANGVFAGNCGENNADSDGLAMIYGEASGYPYGLDFDSYPVSGTAPGWVDSIGIPALDVELASADIAEPERNLRAIMAVQSWVQRP